MTQLEKAVEDFKTENGLTNAQTNALLNTYLNSNAIHSLSLDKEVKDNGKSFRQTQ